MAVPTQIMVALLLGLSPQIAKPSSSDPIESAIKHGDVQAINIVVRDLRLTTEVSNFLLSLARGDSVQEILGAAKTCREAAIRHGAKDTALKCALVEATLRSEQGDFPTWAQLLLWVHKNYPEIPQSYWSGSLDVASLASKPIPDWRGSDDVVTLPVLKNPWSMPVTMVYLNGTPIRALIDTGTDRALTISKVAATKARIHLIDGSLNLIGNDAIRGTKRRYQDSVGIADKFTIANLDWRNLGVVITPELDQIGVDAIVGLDAIEKFRSIEFRPDKLILNNSEPCDKYVPVHFTTELRGRRYPSIPVEIGTNKIYAMFDSGAQGPVEIDFDYSGKMSNTFESTKSRLVLSGSYSTKLLEGNIDIGLGTLFRGRVAAWSSEYVRPTHDANLGVNSLPGKILRLDIQSKRLCEANPASTAIKPTLRK